MYFSHQNETHWDSKLISPILSRMPHVGTVLWFNEWNVKRVVEEENAIFFCNVQERPHKRNVWVWEQGTDFLAEGLSWD